MQIHDRDECDYAYGDSETLTVVVRSIRRLVRTPQSRDDARESQIQELKSLIQQKASKEHIQIKSKAESEIQTRVVAAKGLF